jgi:transcriptional antiterminator RfaH
LQSDPWQVLHVATNHEKLVGQHLAVRSVEHYLPLYTERAKWTDRVVIAERPLFPGYLFVRFVPQGRRSVISTPGVIRVLGDEERDMVSCAELDQIRNGLASGSLLRPHVRVTVGTHVRVCAGVFAGVEGLVTEFRRQPKVIITLAAVSQCFSLEVELGDIEVVKGAMEMRGLQHSLHSAKCPKQVRHVLS